MEIKGQKFIKESGEMYLETILVLSKRIGFVRSVDIVNETGHSKSSVSKAVNILKNNDYILVGKDGGITFTEKGEAHAKEIYERHHILKDFLIKLGVSEETAENDACRVEHVISKETVEKIKENLKKL